MKTKAGGEKSSGENYRLRPLITVMVRIIPVTCERIQRHSVWRVGVSTPIDDVRFSQKKKKQENKSLGSWRNFLKYRYYWIV